MARKEVPCNSCGKPAIVQISNMVHGKRIMFELCMACADRRSRGDRGAEPLFRLRLKRSDVGGILIAVGLFVSAVSVLADFLQFGSSEGFGWQQGAGLALAGMLALTGSVFGVLVLIVIGIIIGSLTLLADVLAFGSHDGFGTQQVIGSLIGGAILVAGLWTMSKPAGRTPEPLDMPDSDSSTD